MLESGTTVTKSELQSTSIYFFRIILQTIRVSICVYQLCYVHY